MPNGDYPFIFLKMYFLIYLTSWYTLFTIPTSISASPLLSIFPDLSNAVGADHADQNRSTLLLQGHNTTNTSGVGQLTGVNSLSSWELEWHISDTLYLEIFVSDWDLKPASIVEVLDATESALGKKVATGLLEEKFTQKTGSVMNTMVFSVTPNKNNARLRWGDVAELIGKDGLPHFYQMEFGGRETWRSVVFDIFDTERGGNIGSGYLRKWWMVALEGGGVGNGTMLEGRNEKVEKVVE